MKRNYYAFLWVTVLFLLSSCQLFTSKQASSGNPLIGKWKMDSIAIEEDSSSFGYLLLGMAIDEGLPYDFDFSKDSVTFYSKGEAPSKVPYSYIDSSNQLIIKDHDMDTYVIRRFNNSTTTLQSRDSAVIFLKKR